MRTEKITAAAGILSLLLLVNSSQAQTMTSSTATKTLSSTTVPATKSPTSVDTTAVRPFTVNIPETKIADLKRRLAATRLPTKELVRESVAGRAARDD
jgi:hypothetical protein